jgi:hyperosmotically inducible protein
MVCGKRVLVILLSALVFMAGGCEVLLIGGAATAGYKLGTDEKTISESADDALITSTIKTRLLQDKYVHALNIDVDTNLGEVTLNGMVESQEEANRAVTIAKGVKGVKKVVSLLKVRNLN